MGGALFLILGLIGLLGKKRTLSGGAALLLLISPLLPVFAAPNQNQWMTPEEAYGLSKDERWRAYFDLAHEMDRNPPQAMEVTLMTLGVKHYEKSERLEEKQLLILDGSSENFTLTGNFEEFKFTSIASLHQEADGWYVDSSTNYDIRDSWARMRPEGAIQGNYKGYEKCSFFSNPSIAAASYRYDNLAYDKIYLAINIDVIYETGIEDYDLSLGSTVYARVDKVLLGTGEQEANDPLGRWVLKEVKNFLQVPDEGNNLETAYIEEMDSFAKEVIVPDVHFREFEITGNKIVINDVFGSENNPTSENIRGVAFGDLPGQSADDAAKQAAPPKNVKNSDAYKKASQQVDDELAQARAVAAEKIEKYRNNANQNPDLALKNQTHAEGAKIGMEKTQKLEKARKALEGNPDSPQLKKDFQDAVKEVQINKHAQKIMNEKGLTSNATRESFNDMKVKQDAVVSPNTSERVALELGLDPKNVSNAQATNTMDTSGIGDIKGVAVKSDFKVKTDAQAKVYTEADLNLAGLEKKGGEKISIDLDQTYRMQIEMKDGTVISKDIPAEKIREIQNEEVYKIWNDGKLPLKGDGSIDHDLVKKFADDMDYTIVDARSADAYGTLGDLQQALKNDGSIRQYSDPEAVSKTIAYKSDEWMHKGGQKMAGGDLIGAEGDIAEGIRQSTKQFESQYIYQIKAINADAGRTQD